MQGFFSHGTSAPLNLTLIRIIRRNQGQCTGCSRSAHVIAVYSNAADIIVHRTSSYTSPRVPSIGLWTCLKRETQRLDLIPQSSNCPRGLSKGGWEAFKSFGISSRTALEAVVGRWPAPLKGSRADSEWCSHQFSVCAVPGPC